jgi:hypothetical protein
MNLESLTDTELLELFQQKQSQASSYNAQQLAFKISLNSLYRRNSKSVF